MIACHIVELVIFVGELVVSGTFCRIICKCGKAFNQSVLTCALVDDCLLVSLHQRQGSIITDVAA